jgi:hypothetical protein
MSNPFYLSTRSSGVHQGDVYRFRPVPWLSPPLWILDYIDWTNRQATIRRSNLNDAFRDRSQGNQEYIIADAKLRYVIALFLATPRAPSASVIPVYSFADFKNPAFLQAVRQGRPLDKFYLPADDGLGIRESYADLSKTQPMHTGFLTDDAKVGRLSPSFWRAMLVQYSHCLGCR